MRHITRAALAALIASSSMLALPAVAQEAIQAGATFIAAAIDPTKGSSSWALVSHASVKNCSWSTAKAISYPSWPQRPSVRAI
ncbi:hypothetical protein [Nitratireductor aquibiodomus]|uniref:hypothetical protein n=1 Tax=Nitratireductor aquibiodomus TaxID=204799 RepID=UPI001FCBC800|nr:hypothetical protein [Nitratireductor aquibiodomus]